MQTEVRGKVVDAQKLNASLQYSRSLGSPKWVGLVLTMEDKNKAWIRDI